MLRKPKEVDQIKAHQLLARAARAEALAQDEMLTEAFDQVEAVYMNAWRTSDPFNSELRERAWIATQLLSDIKTQLLNAVREGVAAQKQIERTLR